MSAGSFAEPKINVNLGADNDVDVPETIAVVDDEPVIILGEEVVDDEIDDGKPCRPDRESGQRAITYSEGVRMLDTQQRKKWHLLVLFGILVATVISLGVSLGCL